MKKQNVRTLSLIVCTFTYLLVGAAVFDALESEFEKEDRRQLLNEENELRDKYNISDEDFFNLTRNVIRSQPHKAGIQWKFAGAFYFATTVITTIGYGHSTPRTVGGKIFCIIYALPGIPLGLIMFQSIGERLNTFITFILKHMKTCFRMKNTEVSQSNLIMVGVNMCGITVLCGAYVFNLYEGWNMIDAIYYCCITLTTIGFGDLVALQQSQALQDKPEYVAFSLIFILFGLTVVSGVMNLLVLRFLTMNTEDERRDEVEAAAAAQQAVRLDGDVITANGNVMTVQQELPEYSDMASVCSCSCYNIRDRSRHRYSVTRSPGKIFHLLPSQSCAGGQQDDEISRDEDEITLSQCQMYRQKRLSI